MQKCCHSSGGKTLGPKRGKCFSSAPSRKGLVFFPPARRTGAAMDAEIEKSTRKQRVWDGFWSKSAPAGVAASRLAALKKRWCFFPPAGFSPFWAPEKRISNNQLIRKCFFLRRKRNTLKYPKILPGALRAPDCLTFL